MANSKPRSSTAKTNKIPVQGCPPVYTDQLYSTASERLSNNCYSYSLALLQHERGSKLQPGQLSGNSNAPVTCKALEPLVLRDGKQGGWIRSAEWGEKCPKGWYRICLLVSPGKKLNGGIDNNSSFQDYHFVRQNGSVMYSLKSGETLSSVAKRFRVPRKNVQCLGRPHCIIKRSGTWSHKRGLASGALLEDATGKDLIFDPRAANWDFQDYNYNKTCCCFFVKRRETQVGAVLADKKLVRERLEWARVHPDLRKTSSNNNKKNKSNQLNFTKKK